MLRFHPILSHFGSSFHSLRRFFLVFFPEVVRLQKSNRFDKITFRFIFREEEPVLNLDPSVKRETGYIAAWTGILSLVMEAVFLLLRQWDVSVLLGNLGGAAAAVGNFYAMARTVSQAVEQGDPKSAATRVRASAAIRMLTIAGICALLIGLAKTNPFATLIPLLFPRVGIMFWPLAERKRKAETAGTEGSELD